MMCRMLRIKTSSWSSGSWSLKWARVAAMVLPTCPGPREPRPGAPQLWELSHIYCKELHCTKWGQRVWYKVLIKEKNPKHPGINSSILDKLFWQSYYLGNFKIQKSSSWCRYTFNYTPSVLKMRRDKIRTDHMWEREKGAFFIAKNHCCVSPLAKCTEKESWPRPLWLLHWAFYFLYHYLYKQNL